MRESLSVTDKGKTANTIDNCRIVFCCDPLLRDAIRLNLLTDRVDIVRDLGWRRNTSALTDTDVKYLLLYFEQNYELTSEKKITAALSIVANENCYHPIQDVLNSLVWDGTPRIRSCLHHFLGADESDYVEEMLKHFLLGAIRRVFRPGSKYEEMLCLVGGQGAGKSTFFRLLAIRDEWFSDDLKKLDDDRVFQKLQGHWIIEMSEMLATSSAKSIEEIRSFISRQKETYRTPYESQPKDRLRQCVFGGSSNTLDFLPLDRAGNRRFLPIMIYSENAEVHILEDEDASRAYLLQVWAEAMTIYAFCIYPVDSEEYIPYCNQQPPNQDETANHSTNNKVQQEQRKGGSQRAARYDPGEHPWDAKRQTAKYEQPYIVGDTIFCASGFENAVQQSRHRHGQHTLFEKLFDYFGFRHSQHLHSWFHYISRITMRPGVLQRL